MTARHSIRYGDERIEFSVGHSSRLSQRVRITVRPDGQLHAQAPLGTPLTTVADAVRQRARWISQRLSQRREQLSLVLPREYVSGETHWYLGRRYVLKVLVDKPPVPCARPVRLWRGRLDVTVAQSCPAETRRLLDQWYRERASDVFGAILLELWRRMGVRRPEPPWCLRAMRARWGSCSPSGKLVLNPHLVKAPRVCIEYVIAHELCHLMEHNHSPRFYRLLGGVLPDWRERKAELDGIAERLLNR